jgi:beta-xylosidase
MLTQRPFKNYDESVPTIGTTKMDISEMKDGDIAGLAVYQDPYAYIAVKQENGNKQLIMVNNGETIATSPMVKGTTIYLRTIASNTTKKATFEYSYDNKMFTKLGNELTMNFSLKLFTGNKFGLFNYATKKIGGFVDFDWFRMK